jgi:hypothetical protein
MSQKQKPRTRRYILHFNNAPLHNTEEVEQTLQKHKFLRLEHRSNSLDLSPCDFFLFGYLHEKMKLLSYETIDELDNDITKTIEAVPKGILIDVFMPGDED